MIDVDSCWDNDVEASETTERVHQPSWYKFGGCELMDHIAGMPFVRGSAIMYLARAGRKPGADELEDLRKALECTKREIQRVETEHMQIKGAHKAVIL